MSKYGLGFIVVTHAMLIHPVFAGDLSSDVRRGTSSPNSNEGNYVEVGMSIDTFTSPYYGVPQGTTSGETIVRGTLDLNLNLHYKRWFVEGFSQSLEQFTFGYNVANNDSWSFDAVALQQHAEISKDISKDLKGINERKEDFMLGIRTTGYWNNYIVQLHALTDISDTHSGQVYSAKIAHHWQQKNWNFHAILGSSYRTQSVTDYYYSVHADDASEKFPEFQAQAGFTHVFEIGATYPINQKWVFRSLYRHVELDQQWVGSPFIIEDHADLLINSISYVF